MNCNLYRQTPFRRAAGAEFRPGGLELTDKLAAACALRPGERVLDLACGAGATAAHLSRLYHVKVTGLDASAEFLAEARQRNDGTAWVLGHAEAISFPDGWFDAVFAECFLSSLVDPGAVLAEVRRVLRPGGRLAVSDMYLREPGLCVTTALVPPSTCLCGARGKEATIAAFEQNGFSVTAWEDRSDTLKVLMAALIMEYGSAAAFWEAVAGEDGAGSGAALSVARPGYYLLVAEASPCGKAGGRPRAVRGTHDV